MSTKEYLEKVARTREMVNRMCSAATRDMDADACMVVCAEVIAMQLQNIDLGLEALVRLKHNYGGNP